jgi:thiol-disulfide isomerase/thioredoxin
MRYFFLSLLFISTLGWSQKQAGKTYAVGEKIAAFSFPDKDGKKIELSSLKGKKLVIVEVWASWCGPCVEEMKRIPGFRAKYPDLEFYSISIDQSPALMKKFVEKKQYDWPVVYAGNDEFTWAYFQIKTIPRYFLIDSSGTILKAVDHLREKEFQRFL